MDLYGMEDSAEPEEWNGRFSRSSRKDETKLGGQATQLTGSKFLNALASTTWVSSFAVLLIQVKPMFISKSSCLMSMSTCATSHSGTNSETLSLMATWLSDSIKAFFRPRALTIPHTRRTASSSPWRGEEIVTEFTDPLGFAMTKAF